MHFGRMIRYRNSFLHVLILFACSSFSQADDGWTRLRGENGVGVHEGCKVPLPWKSSDVAWSRSLEGGGHGSPVVYNGRIFLMSADPDSAERYLLCFELKTGKEIWRKTYRSSPHIVHPQSSYASCTPCVNDEHVFFAWASPEEVVLKALTHDGKEAWTNRLGKYVSQHGFGASPVLIQGKLILLNSQQAQQLPPGAAPGQSRVMAFDPADGAELWTTSLKSTRVCYGCPSLFKTEAGDDALLFSNTGNGLFALKLDDGSMQWNKPVFVKRSVSCPQVVGNLAIGTEGSGGGGNILYAVDLKGDHAVRFKIDRNAPYVPTPVSKGNLLFLWADNGMVTCLRLPEGKVVWRERVGGNVSSSPVIAGDKLVGVASDGTVTVLAATDKFQKLGSVKLNDVTRATPMLSENYMLVRTNTKLLCVGQP